MSRKPDGIRLTTRGISAYQGGITTMQAGGDATFAVMAQSGQRHVGMLRAARSTSGDQ